MPRVQVECIPCQLLGFPPIVFHGGVGLFDQGIGQNGAGYRIVFIQFVGLTQQLDSVGRLLPRAQLLAFGHEAVGFGFALHAVLGKLLELR